MGKDNAYILPFKENINDNFDSNKTNNFFYQVETLDKFSGLYPKFSDIPFIKLFHKDLETEEMICDITVYMDGVLDFRTPYIFVQYMRCGIRIGDLLFHITKMVKHIRHCLKPDSELAEVHRMHLCHMIRRFLTTLVIKRCNFYQDCINKVPEREPVAKQAKYLNHIVTRKTEGDELDFKHSIISIFHFKKKGELILDYEVYPNGDIIFYQTKTRFRYLGDEKEFDLLVKCSMRAIYCTKYNEDFERDRKEDGGKDPHFATRSAYIIGDIERMFQEKRFCKI